MNVGYGVRQLMILSMITSVEFWLQVQECNIGGHDRCFCVIYQNCFSFKKYPDRKIYSGPPTGQIALKQGQSILV